MSIHSSFICFPHVDDCDCQPKDEMLCNPYYVSGYCPTEGEGDACEADPSRLVRVPVAGGFTHGIKES
jgi:hypothetical protein